MNPPAASAADPVPGARLATAGDLADLERLAELARDEAGAQRGGGLLLAREHRGSGTAAWWSDALDAGHRTVLVGCIGPAVVGYGVLVVEELDGPPLAVVEAIFVEPDAREVGVGRAVIDALVAEAVHRGCRGIDARALPGDRDTKNFFESAGLVARLLTVHRDLTPDDVASGDPR